MKIKGQNVLIRFSDTKELFITMLFLQNCGPHSVPSTVVWCSRKRIGTRERKHTARLTLTAQVYTELQHNTFGKATIGHE